MNRTLLVITDLGSFRAYSFEDDGLHSTPRLEPLEDFSPPEMDHRYANTLTTRAGRSAQGNMNLQSAGNNSDGESHNMEIEKRRRALKLISERLSRRLADPRYAGCFLAAPREINSQLLDELSPATREKIKKNLPLDLTRVEKSELLEHFTARPQPTA